MSLVIKASCCTREVKCAQIKPIGGGLISLNERNRCFGYFLKIVLITSFAAAITGNRIVHAGNRPLIETQSRVQHSPSQIQVRYRVKVFGFGFREYGA